MSQSEEGQVSHPMAPMPLVSVVVRTQDRPKLLQEALSSIAEQTHARVEMVVINDGGPDVSELVNGFEGKLESIKYVIFSHSKGRTAAANAGLNAATGDYLSFLDDDDLIKPNHIEQLLEALHASQDCRAAYASVQCIAADGTLREETFGDDFDAVRLLAINYIPIHAILFHRSLLQQRVKLDENLDLYEDWDLMIQLSQLTSFCHVDAHSALYRFGGHSGAGLEANPKKTAVARQQILSKWRGVWSDEQLALLMDRVIAHTTLHRQVDQLHCQVDQLEKHKTYLEMDNSNLRQTQSHHEQHIKQLQNEVSRVQKELHAILNSTSWRLTASYRWLGNKLKSYKGLLRYLNPLKLAKTIAKTASNMGGYRKLMAKIVKVYRQGGFPGLMHVFVEVEARVSKIQSDDYTEWVRCYDTLTEKQRNQFREKVEALAEKPLISVVMPTYNPKPEWLEAVIESVVGQLYPNWELCIADDHSTDPAIRPILERYQAGDSRIKVVFREVNGHISAASNSALEVAKGEWIALLDHDDLLSEHALYWVADAINSHTDISLIYSDEDKIDEIGNRHAPYFKCDWNPDLFYSQNMFSHLGVYKREVIDAVNGFRLGQEGSQDYDLALRCIEQVGVGQIHHIPRVLYHWRVHVESTAHSGDAKPYAMMAGERVLNEHFERMGVAAKAELIGFGYRVHYALPETPPLVSLIMPTKNGLELTRQCIDSIFEKTTYPNYEILIVDNGSDDPAVLSYFEALSTDPRVRILRDDRPFNFSQLNNTAVEAARGDVLGLINNDIEVISPEWLSEMVSHALRSDVGAVGAKLWYPDDTLQHGGVVLGYGANATAGHAHHRFPRGHHGYFGRMSLISEFSAVTAACLVIQKSRFLEVGGLNEYDLKIAFNDVDFCLRLKATGYRNIWTPYAELYHHESATRGNEYTPEKYLRFITEVEYMKQSWGELLLADPAYSPNLTLDYADFSYAWPPRLDLQNE